MVKFSALSDCPLISVIVPSFNQGRFIRQTLDSILKQDYRPIEVVVVDGASTDHTVEVLHEYDGVSEVKWISEPDSGVVEAVNKGFARAQGEVAAVQSSDDFYLPGAIRQGVEELRSDRSLGFTSGDIVKIDAEGRTLSQTRLKEFSIENILAAITWIPQPSTFFRLDLAKSLGGWREEVPYAADTDLWMRMMLKAPAKKIDALFAKRRMHDVQRDKQGAHLRPTKFPHNRQDLSRQHIDSQKNGRHHHQLVKFWLWLSFLLLPPLTLLYFYLFVFNQFFYRIN